MRTALLLSCLISAHALPAQDIEFGTPVRTTIEALRANPDAYQNVKVQFTAQFASLGRISNPFFTKFTPTEYTNFYAWGDDQPIWQEPSYNDVFGMLFLSKSNPQLEQLYTMPLYTRVKCTGVVRNTFQNIPWVEVLSFSKLGPKLDTAVLTHLHRGEQLMEQRLWQRAVAELSLRRHPRGPQEPGRLPAASGRAPGSHRLPAVGHEALERRGHGAGAAAGDGPVEPGRADRPPGRRVGAGRQRAADVGGVRGRRCSAAGDAGPLALSRR